MKTLKRIIKDHIEYRTQIVKLAKADIAKTYRGSALGWSWAIIKPAVTIFVYWFAFTIGIRASKPVNGFPFFLWMIAGMIPWFYISDMLTQGTDCFRKYSYLITKMKFPVATIPTFVSLSKMMINIVLLTLVGIIFACFGFMPTIYYLQIPIYILLAFIFFTGWSLFAANIAAMSKDFSNLVKSFVTAVFWLSGILWNSETVKVLWLKNLLRLNPVTYIVNGFRHCFIDKIWIWEEPKILIHFMTATIIMWFLAIWSHKKYRKEIPDVL